MAIIFNTITPRELVKRTSVRPGGRKPPKTTFDYYRIIIDNYRELSSIRLTHTWSETHEGFLALSTSYRYFLGFLALKNRLVA